MNEPQDPNSPQPSSDSLIPFTEAQLTALTTRQTQYYTEARNKMNYDIELAAQLDDRVQAAIRQGKKVTVQMDKAGFVCE
jgi:hypothetical protein